MPLNRMGGLEDLLEPEEPGNEFTQWRAAVVCAAVNTGGFVLGTAKGAVRILPGPRYQVSVIGNGPAGWTTVPLSQFRLWQASFVREDGLFMFFGLVSATAFIALLHLRREATRASL